MKKLMLSLLALVFAMSVVFAVDGYRPANAGGDEAVEAAKPEKKVKKEKKAKKTKKSKKSKKDKKAKKAKKAEAPKEEAAPKAEEGK